MLKNKRVFGTNCAQAQARQQRDLASCRGDRRCISTVRVQCSLAWEVCAYLDPPALAFGAGFS